MKRLFIFLLAFTLIGVLGMGKTYAAEPEDLAAWWKFDNDRQDSSINDNQGISFNENWVDGKYDKAIQFDGTSTYFVVNDDESLDIDEEITIESWIYPTAINGYRTIVSKRLGSIANYAFRIWDGKLEFYYRSTGDPVWSEWTTDTSVISLNTWQHVAVTYKFADGTLSMLVNGVQKDGHWQYTSYEPTVLTNDFKLYVGSISTTGQTFQGNIDELKIWNKVIEINQCYVDDFSPIVSDITIIKDHEYINNGETITIRAKVQDDISGVKAVSADFSFNDTYTSRPAPQSILMNPVSGYLDYNYELTYPVPSTWNQDQIFITVAARDFCDNYVKNRDLAQELLFDRDNDMVADRVDFCSGTVADEIEELGVNRHIWLSDNYFTTLVPVKRGQFDKVDSQFTLETTHGCSCSQILDRISDKTGDDLTGHYKFGCSKSIMEEWINGEYPLESVIVDSNGTVSTTNHILKSLVEYKLVASGIFYYDSILVNWADAEWYLKGGVPVKGDTEGSKPYVLDISINGTSTNTDWGEYNPEHIYTKYITGTDERVDFSIYDSYSGDNSGFLNVDIFVKLY